MGPNFTKYFMFFLFSWPPFLSAFLAQFASNSCSFIWIKGCLPLRLGQWAAAANPSLLFIDPMVRWEE